MFKLCNFIQDVSIRWERSFYEKINEKINVLAIVRPLNKVKLFLENYHFCSRKVAGDLRALLGF